MGAQQRSIQKEQASMMLQMMQQEVAILRAQVTWLIRQDMLRTRSPLSFSADQLGEIGETLGANHVDLLSLWAEMLKDDEPRQTALLEGVDRAHAKALEAQQVVKPATPEEAQSLIQVAR